MTYGERNCFPRAFQAALECSNESLCGVLSIDRTPKSAKDTPEDLGKIT